MKWASGICRGGGEPSEAFHVLWPKSWERRKLHQVHYALCLPFLLTKLVHRWATIISLCVHCCRQGTSFSDRCNPLLFMIVWDFLGSRLNTICWITETSLKGWETGGRGCREIKCKQKEWKLRSQDIHNDDVMLAVRWTTPESRTF